MQRYNRAVTMTRAGLLRVAVPASALALITLAFYSAQTERIWVHNLLQHLYFAPIAAAGVSFGWRGGLLAAVLATVCYLPHLLGTRPVPTERFDYVAAEATEILDYFVVGLVTGVLAGREQRQRDELQRTTGQLAAVYQELQQNFERMKRSDRLSAVGQLSAGLAHEIRNPLASIEGAAAILRKKNTSEQRREEFLEIIERESARLNRLLTHFLEFARPRPPQYQRVTLGPILESVAKLTGHLPVRLKLDVPSDLAPVTCDPEQMKQVFLNLAINAIQATPASGPAELTARTRGDRVAIEVRDCGPGIRPGDLDRVFDPFFTTKDAGTGLGLAVAHQIVTQHGGILTARNNAETGATFTVELPVQHGRVL